MEPSYPERRRRGLLRAFLAAGALLCLLPAHAAGISDEEIDVSGDGLVMNINAGTESMDNLELRQGNTLIKAKHAEGSSLANGRRNGSWVLKGEVHIEFDGAVLDADSATVKFVDNRLKTVVVLGKPASFSHTLRNSERGQGTAEKIDYDAGTSDVRFSGRTAFQFDTYRFKNEVEVRYNLKDGTVRTPQGSRSEGTYQPTEKQAPPADTQVPPPRTPDRTTAQ
jgi:lipopolysaccharide transport protein LptA